MMTQASVGQLLMQVEYKYNKTTIGERRLISLSSTIKPRIQAMAKMLLLFFQSTKIHSPGSS